MKFNIEIDLDWVNEDNSVDDEIKNQIINNLSSTITQKAQIKVDEILAKKVEEAAKKTTDGFIEKIMLDSFDNMKIPVKKNSWDDKVGYMSLTDFIKERFEKAMNEKRLDSNGSNRNYDKKISINEYFLNQFLAKEMEEKVVDLIKKARIDAENSIIKTLDSTLKEQLSSDIVSRLNIPELLKNLQQKTLLTKKEK